MRAALPPRQHDFLHVFVRGQRLRRVFVRDEPALRAAVLDARVRTVRGCNISQFPSFSF